MRNRFFFTVFVPIVIVTAIICSCAVPATAPAAPSPATTVPTPTSPPTTTHSTPIPLPNQQPAPTFKSESVPSNDATLPIVDMHAHFQPTITPERILENMKKANVTKCVLMPNNYPYDEAKDLAIKYPNNLIAFIGFQNGEWLRQRSVFLDKVEEAIKTGGFRGLGEVLLRHYAIPNRGAPDITISADSSNFRRVLSLSENYNMPVTIHMEAEEKTVSELEAVIKNYPKSKVIWAHAGRAEASSVNKMLDTYPNLFIDIAALETFVPYSAEKNPITTENGMICNEWIQLLIKFQDRVVTGSDMPFPDMWTEGLYPKIMESQRDLLKQLPRDVAEKIAFKNALILLRENIN